MIRYYQSAVTTDAGRHRPVAAIEGAARSSVYYDASRTTCAIMAEVDDTAHQAMLGSGAVEHTREDLAFINAFPADWPAVEIPGQ